MSQPSLKAGLGLRELTLVGVGNSIGAGIFVLTGVAAANYAGPAISISYLLAGVVCFLTALCYAELGSMYPESGGSYNYALRSMGRIPAWFIAWGMILEYLVAASTVAVGWSGYFTDFLRQLGIELPAALTASTYYLNGPDGGAWRLSLNLPAALAVAFCTSILLLNVRRAAQVNNFMVAAKLIVIIMVVVFGIAYVDAANWSPFVPPNEGPSHAFGITGVFTASAIAFFSYTGFEAISTASREANNPQRTIPQALILTLITCAVLYISVALVITGLAHYSELDTSFPLSTAIRIAAPDGELAWLLTVVNVGIVIGLVAAVLISIFGQSRIFYAMARERQAPRAFAQLSSEGVPVVGVLTVGIVAGLIAGMAPLSLLGGLVSLGSLFAFGSVCASVLILRFRAPAADRPFRIPGGSFVALVGLFSCAGLMFSLPMTTWAYFAGWMSAGAMVYVIYTRVRRPS